MPRPPLRASVLTAAALVTFALAACTTAPAPTPTSTPSLSPADQAAAAAETHLGECVDGFAQLSAADGPSTLDDCPSVSILGSGADITLGTVETLTIEGDDNTVTAGDVESVLWSGTGNTLSHTGADPDVTDLTDTPETNTVHTR